MHTVKFKLKKSYYWEKEEVQGIYLDTISLNNSVKNDDQATLVYYNGNVHWLQDGKVIKTIQVL